MKKLLLLTMVALFTIATANVFGQSTGAAPSIGATHKYWVNGTDIGAITTGKEGGKYTWYISDGSNNLNDAIANNGEFSVASGYNTETTDLNGVSVKWNPTSAGKTYYLVVKENGVDNNLCINAKAYAIQPLNRFTVTFAALAGNEASAVGNNLDRCAPDIVMSASGTTITYDYKGGDYIYKITANGLYTKWTLDYLFAIVKGNATQNIEYSLDGGITYATFAANGSDFEIPANAAGTQTVFVKVKLTNGTTAGIYEEGLAAQTIKLTLSDIKDEGGNAVTKVFTSDGTTEFSGAAEQTQTVKARPATTGIQSN